jgi:photosystem II PsbU protein
MQMKRLGIGLCVFLIMLFASWGVSTWTQSSLATTVNFQPINTLTVAAKTTMPLCAESNVKIDLNNANANAFTDCPGFYPNLARLIIEHSPYQKVEDVLNIPELSDRQKDLLQANLNSFKVAESTVLLEQRMPPRPSMR